MISRQTMNKAILIAAVLLVVLGYAILYGGAR